MKTLSSFRQATPADAELACQVLRQSISELCVLDHRNDPLTLDEWLKNKTPENVRGWFSDPDKYCVIADIESEVSGVGSITAAGEIGLLYVVPQARFMGLSKGMLVQMEEWALNRKLAKVSLLSTGTAKEFYELQGYHSNGEPTKCFGELIGYPMIKVIAV